MENLILIASLSCVRTLCYLPAGDDPAARDHWVEDVGHKMLLPRVKQGEIVTDQSGRFGQGAPPGYQAGMSYGEDSHLQLELERQALEQVAARITTVVSKSGYPRWSFYFPQEHLPALLERLPEAVRATLMDAHGGDLTKLPLKELEQRFLEP